MDARAGAVKRSALRLLAAGLLWLGPSQACAAVDWLVLVVDRSKSIDERELVLQRSAYIRLLSDAEVIQALGPAKVSIVEFDTRAEIVVDWAEPAAAARAYQLKPPDGLRGQTGIGGALTTALALLAGKSGRLVIDVSGDGRDNVDHTLLAAARMAATDRAIEVNGLAIMTPEAPEIDRYYIGKVANGFVLSVDQDGDFLDALKRKLFYEVAGGRAPGLVLAAGLSGLAPEVGEPSSMRVRAPAVRRIATAPEAAAARLRSGHGEPR